MPAPSTGYAQIATTIAQMKAIPSGYRADYFCIFLPAIGSWVYYDSTSTSTVDDVQVFLPDDSVGRWLVANQLPYISAANNAANNAVSSHNAATDPHPQYRRNDGVLIATQPNTSTPAYAARVVTGGSNSGGVQVQDSSGIPRISIGVDSGNRGVIVPGAQGLVIGGNTSDRVGFFGRTGTTGGTAIALAGNNTADTRRATNEVITLLKAIGISG